MFVFERILNVKQAIRSRVKPLTRSGLLNLAEIHFLFATEYISRRIKRKTTLKAITAF